MTQIGFILLSQHGSKFTSQNPSPPVGLCTQHLILNEKNVIAEDPRMIMEATEPYGLQPFDAYLLHPTMDLFE